MSAYKIAVATLAVACLNGCAWLEQRGSKPISIQDGLDLTAHDLEETHPVSLADATEDSAQLEDAIFAAQCRFRTWDPLIPVIQGAINIALTGTFTSQVTPTLSVAATGPGGSLGFQVQTAKTQQITVPVNFVTALALPSIYLSQQLALLNGFDQKDPNKARLLQEALQRRDALEVITREIVYDFTPKKAKTCLTQHSGDSAPQGNDTSATAPPHPGQAGAANSAPQQFSNSTGSPSNGRTRTNPVFPTPTTPMIPQRLDLNTSGLIPVSPPPK